jgi:hypothetical protein
MVKVRVLSDQVELKEGHHVCDLLGCFASFLGCSTSSIFIIKCCLITFFDCNLDGFLFI